MSNTAAEKTAKTGYCSWVVIDMKSEVTFYGYRWYTAHTNGADQNREPVMWTLEVSSDGTAWTTVDVGNDPYTLEYGSGDNGYLRGPYGPSPQGPELRPGQRPWASGGRSSEAPCPASDPGHSAVARGPPRPTPQTCHEV